MRKPPLVSLLLVALSLACESKSPTGPSTVTIETPNPATTTTSIPGTTTTTSSTSTSSSTTTIVTPATTRTYVAFGQVPPTVPNQLSLVLQAVGARSAASSFLDRLPFLGTQADSPVWTVLGFYRTASGGAGQVRGELVGTLDDGTFNGTLTAESPECIAEREFAGSLDPQFLRWTGGSTLRDCKGSPLGFNSLLMLATTAPPPTTTAISSSTTTMPLQCSYSLGANGVSVEAAGGQRTVGLTTGPTCGWTVQNFVDWITVQPATGIGSATVSLTVEPNPGAARSATIVIAGLPFIVNQGIPTTTTTTTTSVLALADLLPVTPAASYCRATGSVLSVDVRNQGNATASTSFTRVYFDNGVSAATSIDRLTQSLTANTTTTLTFTIPESCMVARCSILIVADALNAVQESNEANNSVPATCDFRLPEG